MEENKILAYISRVPAALALERLAEIELHCRKQFDSPVLDLGCGDGIFAGLMFTESVDTGMDIDPVELERARNSGNYKQLILAPGDSVPLPENSFSTVFSNSVLEHIPEIEPVLREVLRLLKPGGNFYCTVPSDKFEHYSCINNLLTRFGMDRSARKYRKFYNRFWKHYHCYSVDQWQALAERCGFEVKECFSYNSAGMCLLNDLLAPCGAMGIINKKLFNRWTLLPKIRYAVFYPLAGLIKKILISHAGKTARGGLVYLHLSPKAS